MSEHKIPSLGKMLSIMYRVYSQHIGDLIAPLGFNMTDLAIILGLDNTPGSSLNTFAKEKKINKAILSKSLKKLEQRQLVKLQKDESHKQRFKIYLTAEGEKLVPILRGHIANYEQQIFADLSKSDADSYKQTFYKIFNLEVD